MNLMAEELDLLSLLHRNLNESDYKIIKCYEAQLLGLQMPYDVQALIAQRNEWREQITALQAK